VRASANEFLDIREFGAAPGGGECARASTLRIELPREPTPRGWSIRRHRHGVEADGRHRLNPGIASAISNPHALRAPEPAAGSVIDLRSFTPARGLPARFANNIGVLTIVVRRPVSLVVVSPALLADADPRGSSEEARRNLHADSELVRVDNQLAGDGIRHAEGLPNRLLTAREVARFVGCHEETVRRAYWRGVLRSQRFGIRGKEVSPR
jgi:hypothetical protein